MNKLLNAGLKKYIKSSVFWLSAIAMIICGIVGGIYADDTNRLNEGYIVASHIILSVLISLTIGREIGDGLVRNKIAAGHNKSCIFWSEFLLGIGVTTALYSLFFISFIIPSINSFSAMPFYVLSLMLIGFLFIMLAMVCTFLFFGFVIGNKSIVAIVNIVFILVTTIITLRIYSALQEEETKFDIVLDGANTGFQEIPNPDYISGAPRAIYTFAVNIIPGGQTSEYNDILSPYFKEKNTSVTLTNEELDTLLTLPLYSISFIAAVSLAGWFIFRKKDLN